MGEAKADTQRGWGKGGVRADRGSGEREVQWARERVAASERQQLGSGKAER